MNGTKFDNLHEKFAYGYDANGRYAGLVKRQPCQVNLGVWYMPAQSTLKSPLESKPDHDVIFSKEHDVWRYIKIEKAVEKPVVNVEPVEPFSDLGLIEEYVNLAKIEIYRKVSDEFVLRESALQSEVARLRRDLANSQEVINSISSQVNEVQSTTSQAVLTAGTALAEVKQLETDIVESVREKETGSIESGPEQSPGFFSRFFGRK